MIVARISLIIIKYTIITAIKIIWIHMKAKILHYAKEIVVFLIVMTIIANLVSLYKSSDLNKDPLAIKTLITLDGSKYTIDNEKPILIHFWATWCPTCKVEASNINTIAKDYQVITIAVKSGSNDEIQSYLSENDLDYITINDKTAKLAQKFQISAYPTTFIYDKNKELIFSEVGYTSTWGLWIRMWWANFSS